MGRPVCAIQRMHTGKGEEEDLGCPWKDKRGTETCARRLKLNDILIHITRFISVAKEMSVYDRWNDLFDAVGRRDVLDVQELMRQNTDAIPLFITEVGGAPTSIFHVCVEVNAPGIAKILMRVLAVRDLPLLADLLSVCIREESVEIFQHALDRITQMHAQLGDLRDVGIIPQVFDATLSSDKPRIFTVLLEKDWASFRPFVGRGMVGLLRKPYWLGAGIIEGIMYHGSHGILDMLIAANLPIPMFYQNGKTPGMVAISQANLTQKRILALSVYINSAQFDATAIDDEGNSIFQQEFLDMDAQVRTIPTLLGRAANRRYEEIKGQRGFENEPISLGYVKYLQINLTGQ